MKKIICMILIGVVCLFISDNVSATCTSKITGQKLKAQVKFTGSSYQLMSAQNTATGENAKIYLYDFSALSTSFVAWNQRYLYISLMEEDIIFNENDEVKRYKGSFNGLLLVDVTRTDTLIEGNIEDVNDSISELYITAFLKKHQNDSTSASSKIFNYVLCQD